MSKNQFFRFGQLVGAVIGVLTLWAVAALIWHLIYEANGGKAPVWLAFIVGPVVLAFGLLCVAFAVAILVEPVKWVVDCVKFICRFSIEFVRGDDPPPEPQPEPAPIQDAVRLDAPAVRRHR